MIRVVSLVNSILDVSRMERGFDLDQNGAWIVVRDIVRRVVNGAEGQAQSKGLSLVFESECDHVCVRGDESLIEMAISNLVVNAINYTDKGGITVRCTAEDRGVVIDIEDTGHLPIA